MKVEVVNVRRYPYRHPLPYVYVGRTITVRGFVLRGHGLANPFPKIRGEPAGKTLDKYREWLFKLPQLEARLNCLATEMLFLQIPRLGCWCAPAPCHADILAELIQPIVDRLHQEA